MKVRSHSQGKTIRGLSAKACAVLLFFWNAGIVNAESGHPDSERGFVLSETFQGNVDAIGTITKLDTMVGYRFNRHFEMDAGVPLYFERASSDSTAQGATSGNGIGDVYLSLRFSAGNGTPSFVSSVTGYAPTGDAAKGFSTGRALVDWNNYLGFNIGPLTPFANLGLANSIADTRFFTRPFTSLGTVAHLEGGTYVMAWRAMSVGASAYADVPFGQQKVYSRLIKRGQASPQAQSTASDQGEKRGVFENQSVTAGSASIARDHGGSVWLDIYPRRILDFEVGYCRSVEYGLNSFFFRVGLNLGDWIRSER